MLGQHKVSFVRMLWTIHTMCRCSGLVCLLWFITAVKYHTVTSLTVTFQHGTCLNYSTTQTQESVYSMFKLGLQYVLLTTCLNESWCMDWLCRFHCQSIPQPSLNHKSIFDTDIGFARWTFENTSNWIDWLELYRLGTDRDFLKKYDLDHMKKVIVTVVRLWWLHALPHN